MDLTEPPTYSALFPDTVAIQVAAPSPYSALFPDTVAIQVAAPSPYPALFPVVLDTVRVAVPKNEAHSCNVLAACGQALVAHVVAIMGVLLMLLCLGAYSLLLHRMRVLDEYSRAGYWAYITGVCGVVYTLIVLWVGLLLYIMHNNDDALEEADVLGCGFWFTTFLMFTPLAVWGIYEHAPGSPFDDHATAVAAYIALVLVCSKAGALILATSIWVFISFANNNDAC